MNINTLVPGLLPDHLIRRLIGIEPFAEGVKRPGIISYGLSSIGYDVRLGTKFKLFTNAAGVICMDPKKVDSRAFVETETDQPIAIPPNSYLLGESKEYFRIPRDIGVICIGKSTYARCGIIVNVTPGEPGWEGRWTIEISNSSPIPALVYPNEGIMQTLFFRTVTECETSYADKGGKYQGDQGMRTAAVDVSNECSMFQNQSLRPQICEICAGAGKLPDYANGVLVGLSGCNYCDGSGIHNGHDGSK